MARRGIVRAVSQGRSVALTGSRTFLGRNLIGVLEDDETVRRVVALDIDPPPTGGRKTRFYQLDLTKPGADERIAEIVSAEQIDTFIHLAFVASPTNASAWAHELEAIGTINLLSGLHQSAEPPTRTEQAPDAARERCGASPVRQLLLVTHTWLYGARSDNPAFLTEQTPLNAPGDEPFFGDKIAAEREAERFASEHEDVTLTVLRVAPIVGPTANSFMTRYLQARLPLTLMGFDPMWQLIHEIDAVAALKMATDLAIPGTFNIVGDGVLPLSKVIRLTGRATMPLPHPLAPATLATMWAAGLNPWPKSFLPYLRYVCVADGTRAANQLGFAAAYSSEDALLDFASAERLREVRMAREAQS